MLMRRSLIAFALGVTLFSWTLPVSAQQALPAVNQASTFNGFEVTPGWVEEDDVYGWVCYGRITGALTGNFTLVMDYSGTPTPGGQNLVERGNWTFPVYTKTIRGETYLGVLYGNVSGGDVQWDRFGTATFNLKLNITGGTQSLQGMTGSGELSATTYFDGTKTAMKGDLIFNF